MAPARSRRQFGPMKTLLDHHLRQLLYGGNDGIITTFAIVAGFSGAQLEGGATITAAAVVLFGLANLVADGLSMGMGEFLSSRSEDKQTAHRAARRQDEVQASLADPEGALTKQLAQIGLAPAQAQKTAALIASDPNAMETINRALTAAQTGTQRHDEASIHLSAPAWRKGTVTFLSFICFGLLPILPFLLQFDPSTGWPLSIAATALALTLLGLIRARATAERLRNALGETLGVGGLCALAAYLTGWIIAAV